MEAKPMDAKEYAMTSVDPLELPTDVTAAFECELRPRGKEQQVRIYRIERAPQQS